MMPKRYYDLVPICHLRHEANLTQEELAAKAGCSKRTVEKLEHGGRVIFRTVRELAEALAVDRDLLIRATGESELIQKGRETDEWVEITINREMDDATPEEIQAAFAEMVRLVGKKEVRITRIREGSIICQAVWSMDDALRLAGVAVKGGLEHLSVKELHCLSGKWSLSLADLK
jgi:transcriptional regulator with XRE-family HTH domain